MTTGIVTHEACLAHVPSPHHPESPHRMASIIDALSGEEWTELVWYEAPLASSDHLTLVHPRAHVDWVLDNMPTDDRPFAFDGDTVASKGSKEAVLRAAGSVILAVDEVLDGSLDNAFCAVRPPGHHAEPDRTMGFCFFNNIAIGARHAQQAHGVERVAVVDFDVHHGNGTQAAFWSQASLFYASSHQGNFYPGTGYPSESGLHNNIVNVPLPSGAGTSALRAAYTDTILPNLKTFRPDLIMISAGFDAHAADPLAMLELQADDFDWLTESLCDIADRVCEGRIVSVLEGGYDLDALAQSVEAHVGVLAARDSSVQRKTA